MPTFDETIDEMGRDALRRCLHAHNINLASGLNWSYANGFKYSVAASAPQDEFVRDLPFARSMVNVSNKGRYDKGFAVVCDCWTDMAKFDTMFDNWATLKRWIYAFFVCLTLCRQQFANIGPAVARNGKTPVIKTTVSQTAELLIRVECPRQRLVYSAFACRCFRVRHHGVLTVPC